MDAQTYNATDPFLWLSLQKYFSLYPVYIRRGENHTKEFYIILRKQIQDSLQMCDGIYVLTNFESNDNYEKYVLV